MPAIMTPAQAAQLAARYGITLTDAETALLTTSQLLQDHLEAQEAWLLSQALSALQCPACLRETCQRATLTDPEAWHRDSLPPYPDDGYRCPHCKAGLTWHLAFTGPQFFTLTQPLRQPRPGPVPGEKS